MSQPRPWSAAERAEALEMIHEGADRNQIAERLGRTPDAISNAWKRYGWPVPVRRDVLTKPPGEAHKLQLSARLQPDMYADVRRRAEAEGVPLGEIVRRALEQYLRQPLPMDGGVPLFAEAAGR